MDADARPDPAARDDAPDDERAVRSYETRPGRHVFTERGNTDAWIATDMTVDPEL